MKLRLLIPALCVGTFCSLLADTDVQLWNTVTFKNKPSKNVKVQYGNEIRYRDDMGNFFYYHIEPIVYHRLVKEHYLGVQYRVIFDKSSLGNLRREIRPGILMTNKFQVGKAHNFYTRFKLIYKFKDLERDNHEMIRARFGFTFLNKEWIKIYMSDEMFWNNANTHEFDRNRLQVGLTGKFSKAVGWGLYYMHQEDKQGPGDWTGTHVFGTQLSAKF